jgi:hypothetical protein
MIQPNADGRNQNLSVLHTEHAQIFLAFLTENLTNDQ